MSLQPSMARSVDALRSRFGELLDRARAEAAEQVARVSGRGAVWVEEAGRDLGDGAVIVVEQLTDATGAHVTRAADRVAGMMARWSTGLSDRIVRFGAELDGSRPERD